MKKFELRPFQALTLQFFLETAIEQHPELVNDVAMMLDCATGIEPSVQQVQADLEQIAWTLAQMGGDLDLDLEDEDNEHADEAPGSGMIHLVAMKVSTPPNIHQ
jgi:hypothetical protein